MLEVSGNIFIIACAPGTFFSEPFLLKTYIGTVQADKQTG
jgi:hypothetical protein